MKLERKKQHRCSKYQKWKTDAMVLFTNYENFFIQEVGAETLVNTAAVGGDEAESLKDSSPGLKRRSRANPGLCAGQAVRSERAREMLRQLSRTLSERPQHAPHEPSLYQPGLRLPRPFQALQSADNSFEIAALGS